MEVQTPAPPEPRGRRLGWLWLLLLAGLGYAGFHYYQAAQKKRAAAAAAQADRMAHRAVPVATTAARRGDIPVYLRGLGTVTAYNTVNVRARVDGPLVAVNFREGQQVAAGQVLAEVDPRTFQAVVSQSEGQLARDQAQLNDAKVNLARYQALWNEGVIARQQLDTQSAQVGQFEGSLAVDRANIESARLNLQFTKITAPISGRIGLRQVDIGNMVHAADQNPIAVITQMQPTSVLFTIPADSLPSVLAKMRGGAKPPVDAYDRADVHKIASGRLEAVDAQIDVATGTSRLKATFPNTDNALFPNQFVNCRLLLDTHRGVVLIPVAAVQHGPQGTYVYVAANDGTAQLRQVTLGIAEGNDQEVTGGLQPGELVVTDGQDKLQEGSKIEARQGAKLRGAAQGTFSGRQENGGAPGTVTGGAGGRGPGATQPGAGSAQPGAAANPNSAGQTTGSSTGNPAGGQMQGGQNGNTPANARGGRQ